MKIHMKSSILLLIIVTALSGCTSFHSVEMKPKKINDVTYYLMDPPVYAGEKVKYQLKDGRQGEFVVQTVTPKTISGNNGVTLESSDIKSLEKEEVSKVKTGAAVGGGIAVTTGVVVSLIAVSLGSAIVAALAAG